VEFATKGACRVSPPTDRRFTALACEVSAAVSSSLVLEEVLATVANRIATALNVAGCDLYEYYPERSMVVFSSAWRADAVSQATTSAGTALPVDERPMLLRALESGSVVEFSVDDPGLEPEHRVIMEARGEVARLIAPLIHKGKVIGCILLTDPLGTRRFSAADIELTTMLTVPAALALHNARMFRWQQEQSGQLAALLDSTRALTGSRDLLQTLRFVAQRAAEGLRSDECLIFEFRPETDELVFLVAFKAGDPDAYAGLESSSRSLKDFPSDRELLAGDSVVVESLSDPGLPDAIRDDMEEQGEQTCLSVPFSFGGEPLGLLCLVETTRERQYTAAEIAVVTGIAEQAALAIWRARMHRDREEQNRRLVGLFETSRSLVASLDVRDVVDGVRRETATILGLGDGAVTIRLHAGDGLYAPPHVVLGPAAAAAATDGDPAALNGTESGEKADEADAADAPAAPDPLVGEAMASRAPMLGDIDGGPSRLVVPLFLKDAPEGYLDIAGEQGRAFDVGEIELVQILGNQAAVAVENARLYREIERRAVTDGLTGLNNHRHFYDRLGHEFSRAQRYGTPLSVLMLDVDDFKHFNDTYGHPVGDRVLAAIGALLVGQLRHNIDFAARYGGEEFAVLLPNTPRVGAAETEIGVAPSTAAYAEGAFIVGERIRQAVEQIVIADETVASDIRVTVSIGLAVFPDMASNPEELIRNADKALYLAKHLGKNRVEVFTV